MYVHVDWSFYRYREGRKGDVCAKLLARTHIEREGLGGRKSETYACRREKMKDSRLKRKEPVAAMSWCTCIYVRDDHADARYPSRMVS
jgi:hypothetical protein